MWHVDLYKKKQIVARTWGLCGMLTSMGGDTEVEGEEGEGEEEAGEESASDGEEVESFVEGEGNDCHVEGGGDAAGTIVQVGRGMVIQVPLHIYECIYIYIYTYIYICI